VRRGKGGGETGGNVGRERMSLIIGRDIKPSYETLLAIGRDETRPDVCTAELFWCDKEKVSTSLFGFIFESKLSTESKEEGDNDVFLKINEGTNEEELLKEVEELFGAVEAHISFIGGVHSG
jgi:hypothetical protein